MRTFLTSASAALLLIAGCEACTGSEQSPELTPEQARQLALQQTRDHARAEAGEIRFLVDKSDREVRVYRNGELFRVHAVAVGAPGFQTPSGRWAFERGDAFADQRQAALGHQVGAGGDRQFEPGFEVFLVAFAAEGHAHDGNLRIAGDAKVSAAEVHCNGAVPLSSDRPHHSCTSIGTG